MKLHALFAAAAVAAFAATGAVAQTDNSPMHQPTNNAGPDVNGAGESAAQSPQDPNAPASPQATDPNAAASTATPANVSQAAMPASATTGAGPVMSSPTPADQAYELKAGDPNVVTNGPVPDTKANRAAYGGPMSHAGRHTAATGD